MNQVTVPSARTDKQTVIVCPNCNSVKIKEKWVEKWDNPKPKELSMKEALIDKNPPQGCTDWGIIVCGDFVPIYIQLVLTCENCGWTETKLLDDSS